MNTYWCIDIGYSSINLLEIDGARLLGGEVFNNGCFFEPTLISLKVYATPSSVKVERCAVEKWSWENGYEGKKCTDFDVSR
jgi:hypothetical protein